MDVLAFCMVELGACFVSIDSPAYVCSHPYMVLLTFVHVSFECMDINTAVCRVLCDFDYRLRNEKDEYRVALREMSYEQWIPLSELCIVLC